MWDKDEYFKGISIVKIGAFVLFLFGMMVMVSQVRAQSDNATEKSFSEKSGHKVSRNTSSE